MVRQTNYWCYNLCFFFAELRALKHNSPSEFDEVASESYLWSSIFFCKTCFTQTNVYKAIDPLFLDNKGNKIQPRRTRVYMAVEIGKKIKKKA